MRQAVTLLIVGLSAAAVVGCSTRLPPSNSSPIGSDRLSGKLTLTGSSTLAPLAAEIAMRFESLHPQVRVDVQTGGSSRGIRDARCGAADIGMSSRPLKPDELASVRAETIAWDGVAFVVHRDNPIDALTNEQLVAIYTGEIDNWVEVGGNDTPIIVANRAEGRSELELMTRYLDLEPAQVKADVIDGETQQTIKTVTTSPGAISYTSVGAAQHAAARGSPLKLLPLDGVAASTARIQAGNFPLARPLMLIWQANTPNRLAEEFVRFAMSPDVDDLTASLGYVTPSRDSQ